MGSLVSNGEENAYSTPQIVYCPTAIIIDTGSWTYKASFLGYPTGSQIAAYVFDQFA